MTFDLARAVKEGCRTRDGRPVRIICTDVRRAGIACPVIALAADPDGTEHIGYHLEDGTAVLEDGTRILKAPGLDLVNLPEAHEVTVQLWKSRYGDFYLTAEKPNGMRIGEPLPVDCTSDWIEWGKPVTVRIEKDD